MVRVPDNAVGGDRAGNSPDVHPEGTGNGEVGKQVKFECIKYDSNLKNVIPEEKMVSLAAGIVFFGMNQKLPGLKIVGGQGIPFFR